MYLFSSVPIFSTVSLSRQPLSWLLRLFPVLVIVLYIYVSFSCCYNNVYSYKYHSLNLVTQLLLCLRLGLLPFMYDVRNYRSIRYVFMGLYLLFKKKAGTFKIQKFVLLHYTSYLLRSYWISFK